MSNARRTAAIADVADRTLAAIAVALRRRDSTLVVVATSLAYLVAYSVAAGNLGPSGGSDVALAVAERPLSLVLEPTTNYLTYEPIARVDALGVAYLFSPIEAVIAVALSVLVGTNLALTYLGIVQPSACGLGASSGVFVALPALLSGAACCGPVVLVVLGVQATGLLVAGFQLLVPVAFVLLLGSLLLVGRRVDPALL